MTLSDEQREFRATMRRFCEDKIAPRAASVFMAMSATMNCRPWNSAMGLPNCLRCFMYPDA